MDTLVTKEDEDLPIEGVFIEDADADMGGNNSTSNSTDGASTNGTSTNSTDGSNDSCAASYTLNMADTVGVA